MIVVNEKLNTFLGLNNMLNPSCPEYREGMACRSNKARLNEKGLWDLEPKLVAAPESPSVIASAAGGAGTYYKYLNINGTNRIVYSTLTQITDVGPNKLMYTTNQTALYRSNGVDAASQVTILNPPTINTLAVSTGSGRQAIGTYYYMLTTWDPVNQRESLPCGTVKSATITEAGQIVTVNITAAVASTCKIRIYRSKVTNASEGTYNAVNIFYYLGENAYNDVTYVDLLNDEELTNNEYEGRGGLPPANIDFLVSYNNRMMYFIGNVMYWSSAGRPEEVAQEYNLIIVSGDAVKCKPKLSTGLYGEAKYEITELAGHEVKAGIPFNGRIYIWTTSKFGYIESTNKLEGYRFKLLRDGIGAVNDKVIALTPYGVFGADMKGMWLLGTDGEIERLTDNRIDLVTVSDNDTYISTANMALSFGFWCPYHNEYLWGYSGKFIAYQANRGIFAGPYDYAITGGCAVFSSAGAYVYLTSVQTMSPTLTPETGTADLSFWFGQSAPTTIKDQLKIEIVHSKVPASDVTYTVHQNNITIEGAQSLDAKTYTGSIGVISTVYSSRYFKLDLILPYNSPIALIQYKYNPIPWEEESGR